MKHRFRRKCLPNFLVISPPKTGTSWLFENLKYHPEVYIPVVKELKFFSNHLNTQTVEWYFSFFSKNKNRCTGEISPSYAILPIERIKMIKKIMPDVRLIFLMRNPVERAWSHAKHNFKYKEINFKNYKKEINSIPDIDFYQNFTHTSSLAFGNYFDSLQRWLSVFPKEQIYIGFYESILEDPKKLILEIFKHIDIQTNIEWEKMPMKKKINKGIECDMPDHYRTILRLIYFHNTIKLNNFLKKEFDICIPTSWQYDFAKATGSFGNNIPQTECRAYLSLMEKNKDCDLYKILQADETPPPPLIVDSYSDYNIIYSNNVFYSLSKDKDPFCINEIETEKETFDSLNKLNMIFKSKDIRILKLIIRIVIIKFKLRNLITKIIN